MSSEFAKVEFTETKGFQALKNHAASAYDLTAAGALTPERIGEFQSSACGFDLLYATQRITEEVMSALKALVAETGAQQQFRQLMAGEIMNRIVGHESEERQVLHFASRNVFDDLPDPMDTSKAAEANAKARVELDKLKSFLADVESGKLANAKGEPFSDLVNVGIGGSDLGPKALYMAVLPFRKGGRRVHFVSNVDPDDAAQVLGELDLSRTLINVVSKSGSTLETLTNETLCRTAFEKAGLDPLQHFLCVTGQGSPMDNPERYRATFYMEDYIGGRYAATSMVGAVLLGFAIGYDALVEILRGAREMDLAALNPDLAANPPLVAALLGIWNRNFLGHHTLAVLPYSQGLIRFAAHLQQLDMESNGKGVTRAGSMAKAETGPIVWGEPGTNGQHAFYQLIHQSQTVVPCEFIGFRQNQYGQDLEVQETTSQQKLLANLMAQSIALATGQQSGNPNKYFPGNRPNSVLITDRLTPYALGALLAYYEAKVAYQGLIWNVNSFDQEGVQLGKLLANNLIGHIQAAAQGNGAEAEKTDPTGWALMKAGKVL